jgi:hypothetical protein
VKLARIVAALGLVACSAAGSTTVDKELTPTAAAERTPQAPARSARRPTATTAPTTPASVSAPQLARTSEPGSADLDPDNDLTVAPPDPIPDCDARLTAAGVKYRPATLELRQNQQGRYVCGAAQVVIYERGPGAISYNAAPLVTCGMALALARFELSLQRQSAQALGSRVRRIRQGGTYSCRKMARFSHMVSEHSYANAIDLYAFTLEDGRTLSVASDFGKPENEPTRSEGRFLRELARKTFDTGLFSVVLTPFWDKLHADHFHVDLARYRVDGTR